MRTFVRTIGAIALAALVALVPAAAASTKKPKGAAWAKQHHLHGSWRARDADKDGVKNYSEYKLGTNPRKPDSDKDGLSDGDEVASANDPLDNDSDGDGLKDGSEHAGVVTSFDGGTIRLRQFKGAPLRATIDDGCGAMAYEASFEDEDAFADPDWSDDDADEPSADASSDDDSDGSGDEESCDFEDLEEGVVLTQAHVEVRDGTTYLVGVEIA